MNDDEFLCLVSALRYASVRPMQNMETTVRYISSRLKDMTIAQLYEIRHEIDMRYEYHHGIKEENTAWIVELVKMPDELEKQIYAQVRKKKKERWEEQFPTMYQFYNKNDRTEGEHD